MSLLPTSASKRGLQSGRQVDIAALVHKRQASLSYLRRSHDGDTPWLNIVRLSTQDLQASYVPDELKKRTQFWFVLGLSCGNLLEYPKGSMVVRALSQLLEEHLHHVNRVEKRNKEPKNSSDAHLSHEGFAPAVLDDEKQPVKTALHRVGRKVVYKYLTVPKTSVRMDYFQVVYSLCDILFVIYQQFLHESCQSQVISDAIVRVDRILMEHVIAKIVRELTEIAVPILKDELKAFLDDLYEDGDDTVAAGSTRADADVHVSRRNALIASPSSIFFEDDDDDDEEYGIALGKVEEDIEDD